MKIGQNLLGYRAEIELTILEKKALFSLLVQALDFPENAVAKVALTVATISLAIGITKVV